MNLAVQSGASEQRRTVDKFLIRAADESRLPGKYRLELDRMATYWQQNSQPHWLNPHPELNSLRNVCRNYGLPTAYLNPLIAILEECAKSGICPGTFLQDVIMVQIKTNKNPKEWLRGVVSWSKAILAATKQWVRRFDLVSGKVALTDKVVPVDHWVIKFLAKPYVSLPVREAKTPHSLQFFIIITERFKFINPEFNDFLYNKMSNILEKLLVFSTYPNLCSIYDNLVKIEMGYLGGFLKTQMNSLFYELWYEGSHAQLVNQLHNFLEVFAFIVQDRDFQKLAEQIYRHYLMLSVAERNVFIEELKNNKENRLKFYGLLQEALLENNNYFLGITSEKPNKPILKNKEDINVNSNMFITNLARFITNNAENPDVADVYDLLVQALITGNDNHYSESIWLLFDRVLKNASMQELFMKGIQFIPESSKLSYVSFRKLYEQLKSPPGGHKLFIKKEFILSLGEKPAQKNKNEGGPVAEFRQILGRFKPIVAKNSNQDHSMGEVMAFLDNKIQAIEKHLFQSKASMTSEKKSNLWKQWNIYKKTKEILTVDDVYLKILLLLSLSSFHKEVLSETFNFMGSISPDFRAYANFFLNYYEMLEKNLVFQDTQEDFFRNFLQELRTIMNFLSINPGINDLLEYALEDGRGWYNILCYFSPTKSVQNPAKIWDAIINRVFHLRDFERAVDKITKNYNQPSDPKIKKTKLSLYTAYSPLNYYHKYMGGVCLSPGIGLFANGKGFLLRLVDLENKKVVGCVLAGFHKFQNEDVILFYGINPLRSFLRGLSEKLNGELYLHIRHIMEIISLRFNLPVYIPLSNGILSEGSSFVSIILNEEKKCNPVYSEFKNFGFNVAGSDYWANDVALIIKPDDKRSFITEAKLMFESSKKYRMGTYVADQTLAPPA